MVATRGPVAERRVIGNGSARVTVELDEGQSVKPLLVRIADLDYVRAVRSPEA
jgi:hypothetical protein